MVSIISQIGQNGIDNICTKSDENSENLSFNIPQEVNLTVNVVSNNPNFNFEDNDLNLPEQNESTSMENVHWELENNLTEQSNESILSDVVSEPKKVKKGKKRTRSPKSWKRNIAKAKRLRGEQYKSASYTCNEVIPGRDIKDSCPLTCRRRCITRVTEDQRKQLHSSFWKDFDS